MEHDLTVPLSGMARQDSNAESFIGFMMHITLGMGG